MAPSGSNNRQVIDGALSELANGLRPLVANQTGIIVEADPSALIRLMLERWDDAFHVELGYRVKNLLYEIRDVRNDWARNRRYFDDDETDRALDSIERLLNAIGSAKETSRVKEVKQNRRRARYVQTLEARPFARTHPDTSHGPDPGGSEWEAFARYLRDARCMIESTIRSRVSNCKRVAQFEGDLNDNFRKG